MARVLGGLVVAIAIAAAGCGTEDGDELLSEDSVRSCLAEEGFGPGPGPGPAGVLGLSRVSPDFLLYAEDGTPLAVIIEGSEQKAEKIAADVQASFLTAGNAEVQVLTRRNAIGIFDGAPTGEARAAAEDCLG